MRGLTNSDSGGGGSDLVKRIVVNSIGNGTVTPSGIVAVLKGDSKTFTFSPDAGNRIQDVKLDGASLGAITEKILTNVQTDHTLTAYFTPITYTITKNAGAHGTISGDTTVNWGSTPTYNIVPDSGCRIGNVTVDSTSMGAISQYTFPAVYANHTIAATFVQQFTVTASAGSNGTISPVGTTTYDAGATPTYTISPNTGYTIDTLKVNNQPVEPTGPNQYQFSALSANMTIDVTFKINPFTKYTMTIPSGSGNSVSKNITFSDGAAGWNETQRDNLIKEHTKFAVVKWDGSKPVVNYWLYRANLNHKANDSTCNTDSGVSSVLTGADGDVMVLYDRCWWSITKSGANWVISFTWDNPATSGQSGTWVSPHHYGDSLSSTTYATYVGMGVFEALNQSNQMRSVHSSSNPTGNVTQNNFYAAAISGRNWQYNNMLPMTYAWYIICLYFVNGDRNCQNAYGNGIVGASAVQPLNTSWSATSPWINGTTADQTHGVTALGIHNPWGNQYRFMGEARRDKNVFKISVLGGKDHYNIESGSASTWKTISCTGVSSSGGVTEITGDAEYPFFANGTSGTDYSIYYADRFVSSTSDSRCVLVGGSYNFALEAGPLYVNNNSASASHTPYGARLHVLII